MNVLQKKFFQFKFRLTDESQLKFKSDLMRLEIEINLKSKFHEESKSSSFASKFAIYYAQIFILLNKFPRKRKKL